MAERFCDVGGGITLCYETFGEPADPPLLLIMGLATQMIAWDEGFCRGLAERGFHVVRFDNRDVGHSTHLGTPPPAPWRLLARRPGPDQYTLSEMASDTSGLLRELDLAPAHVVGASLGGMIGQTLAAEHPADVRTLVSIMSTTGSRLRGQPAPSMYRYLLERPPTDRASYVERAVALFAAIGSPPSVRDDELVRELAEASFERGFDPAGARRQLGAALASGNRAKQLRSISAPTLVIHGLGDRLVRPSGGRATARAIPDARLMTIEGMGHDLPRSLWPRLIDAIAEHARRGDRVEARAAAPAAVR